MNLNKIFLIVLVVLVFLVVLAVFFWKFRHNDTLRFIVNSPITMWATKNKQANPELAWEIVQNHVNPPDARDDFNSDVFDPLWPLQIMNGKGTITHPGGEVHASNIELKDGELVLSVLHDPDFENENPVPQEGAPAAETYNNAYVIGFRDYSPTPEQNVVIEFVMRVSKDFHGTTGLWLQEIFNIDPTGRVVKPFRAFGVSFVGSGSNTFLEGLQLEAVTGFVPTCAKKVDLDIDVTKNNRYTLVWSIKNEKQMKVDLYVNDIYAESCTSPIFAPGEAQFWADNFKVDDLILSHLNVPEGTVDQVYFDYISVKTVPVK